MGLQIEGFRRRSRDQRFVPPPTAGPADAVTPGSVVVTAPRSWRETERHILHVRNVIRSRPETVRLVDDFGVAVDLPADERVLVASRTQEVF